MHRSIDILLVTATEIETLAVLELARQQTGRMWSRQTAAAVVYYDLGVVGGAAVCLVQSAMGSVGPGASAQTVDEGIAALKPAAVIMVGIAFGMQERSQHVGDVLVASQLWLYEQLRLGADAAGRLQILSRGPRPDVSPRLLKAFRSGSLDWKPAGETAHEARVPQIHTGLILSGEKLIDNLEVREQLRQIEPEAIGGEMEGAGLYTAAQRHKVDWILVKAICDWADGNKAHDKHERQRLAARNAAEFVLHVIEQVDLTYAASQADLQALHQLPPPVGDFVGRTAEVAQLAQVLRQAAGAALAGIQGMGGVGKTQLACVVAKQVEASFPDAQIFLQLRGTSPAPLTPEQALQTVLRAFAPQAPLPEDLPALEARYHSLLRDRRVLIVADDARGAAQVRPLIPPRGSALLVTSRTRFALPGMEMFDLELLPEAEAVELLRRICPRLEPDAAARLARACGYLPLALRVGASLLRTTPALTAEGYLADLARTRLRLQHLRDPDDPHLDVAATLVLSYAQLDRSAQEVFCQLGVVAGDFTTELAQALVELPERANITPALRQLLRRSLIVYNPAQARWCLHDLVRDLAFQHLEQQGAADTLAWRYARVALQIAQTVDRRYKAGGDEALAALVQFDAERHHLEAGCRWVYAQRATPEGAQLLLALVLATAQIGELREGAKPIRSPRLREAFDAAGRLGQLGAGGQVLLYLGRAVFDTGRFQQALLVWERALVIAQRAGDRLGESLLLGNIGTAYRRLGDLPRAIAAFEKALECFRAAGDRSRMAQALGNLGAVYAEQGNPAMALRYLGQSLAYARDTGNLRFEGMLLEGVGDALCRQGEPRRALAVCKEALAIARKLGDRQQEGYDLITLGRAAVHLGERDLAANAFDLAFALLHEVGDSWGVAECHWHYGIALARAGDTARALPLLHASVTYRSEIGHRQAPEQAALLAQLKTGGLPPAALAAE